MKKLFFAAIIAVFSMTSVNAQQFGVKAGVNFANMSGTYIDKYKDNDPDYETSGRTGFHFGAVVEFELSDQIYLQPEILYSTQGFKQSTKLGTKTIDFTQKMDYLSIPVMFEYKISDEFSIQAGPQIAFLISSKFDWSEDMNDLFNDDGFEADLDKRLEKTSNGMDFGINFGAEYTMDTGLFFNARYSLGLSNAFKYDEDEFSSDFKSADLKNSVFQLSVGYNFDM